MKIALWLVAMIAWNFLVIPALAASGIGLVIGLAGSFVIGWLFGAYLACLYEDRQLKRDGIWPDRRKYRDTR